jgi:uncharacterized membrane protein
MARDVIIATFENRNQSYEAAKDIDKLDDSVIRVQSGIIVEKDMLGNVTQLDSKGLASPWGTIGGVSAGAVLGALVGTLAGPVGTATGAEVGAAAAAAGGLFGGAVGATVDIPDTGLKEDYIAAVSGLLLPGHAAFVAEVDEYSTQLVDEAVWRHGGVVFRHRDRPHPDAPDVCSRPARPASAGTDHKWGEDLSTIGIDLIRSSAGATLSWCA